MGAQVVRRSAFQKEDVVRGVNQEVRGEVYSVGVEVGPKWSAVPEKWRFQPVNERLRVPAYGVDVLPSSALGCDRRLLPAGSVDYGAHCGVLGGVLHD